MKNFNNKKGSLSVDFMFSFVAVFLLLLFLIMTSLTFSLVEVSQYISYATARAYFVDHRDKSDQSTAAREKYGELRESFFKPGQGGLSEWFQISEEVTIGEPPEEITSDKEKSHFFGASFEFTSKVLTIDIPFLGGSTEDSDKGFKFPIASYLGREPSREECLRFNREKWGRIVGGGNPPAGYESGGNNC